MQTVTVHRNNPSSNALQNAMKVASQEGCSIKEGDRPLHDLACLHEGMDRVAAGLTRVFAHVRTWKDEPSSM